MRDGSRLLGSVKDRGVVVWNKYLTLGPPEGVTGLDVKMLPPRGMLKLVLARMMASAFPQC